MRTLGHVLWWMMLGIAGAAGCGGGADQVRRSLRSLHDGTLLFRARCR
jgi:hypothetical protein